MPEKFNWFDYERPEFVAMLPKWRFTRDVASGEYGDPEKIAAYLHCRSQGEPDGMYEDRKQTAKIIMALSKAFTSIVGQLWRAESKQTITFGETLGNADDPLSRAYQLTTNIDGAGTNLDLWQRELVFDLLTYQEVLILVEGPGEEHGPITWKVITPDKMPDYDLFGDHEHLEWAKLVHTTTRRDGPKSKPEDYRIYSLYELDGVRRWQKKISDKDAEPVRYSSEALRQTDARGERYLSSMPGTDAEPTPSDDPDLPDYRYEYWADVQRSHKHLPLVEARLPFKSYLGYLAARLVVNWFNLSSERRNVTRMAATPTVYVSSNNPDILPDIAQKRKEGHTWIAIGESDTVSTLTPPIEVTDALSAIIEDERSEFFNMLLQDYGEAAREVTATKIRADERSGREALLELLAMTVDEAVQTCLFLSEQIEKDQPGQWGLARVDRSGSFRPDDPDEQAEKERKMFLGEEPVPMTEEAFVALMRRQAESAGLPTGTDEAESKAFDEHMRGVYQRRQSEQRFELFERAVAVGMGLDEAARLAGFEADMAAQIIRRDFVPVNGQ